MAMDGQIWQDPRASGVPRAAGFCEPVAVLRHDVLYITWDADIVVFVVMCYLGRVY